MEGDVLYRGCGSGARILAVPQLRQLDPQEQKVSA